MGKRWTLLLVLAYLLMPLDLIPDFIPIAGQADDLIVLLVGLTRMILPSKR